MSAEITHLLGLPIRHVIRDVLINDDLDMNGFAIHFDWFAANYIILERLAAGLRIIDNLGVLKDLTCRNLIPSGNLEMLNGARIRTPANVAMNFHLSSHDGANFQDAITLVGGYADVPRAGNITGVAGAILAFDLIDVGAGNLIDLSTATSVLAAAVPGALINAAIGTLRLPMLRPAAPVVGDCRYDGPTNTFEIWDGANWQVH